MARRAALTALAALLTLAGSGALLGVLLCEAGLHPIRHRGNPGPPWVQVRLPARDGTELAGWLGRAVRPNGPAVLVLHGVAADGSVMRGLGGFLLERGYDVLMPDWRAHGWSGGQLATFGIRETGDLNRWADHLLQGRPGECVFGLGESMGAAILLQALPTEPRLCAVVAESPFSDFRSIAFDRVSQVMGIEPMGERFLLRPVIGAGFWYARLRYGLDLEAASALRAVAASATPVLLIHGPEDRNIPIRHSREIAAARRGTLFWEVPKAGHTAAHATFPREFEDRVAGFFEAARRSRHVDARVQASGSP